MECKLRCVNFRRVSDPRRAFPPAFRVTGTAGDWYRSTMGVIMRGVGTPRSTGENFWCTWEHLGAPTTSLGAPGSAGDKPGSTGNKPGSTGNKSRSTGNKSRSAGDKSGSTSNHSRAVWEKHLLGNTAGAPRNHSYYLSFNNY